MTRFFSPFAQESRVEKLLRIDRRGGHGDFGNGRRVRRAHATPICR